MSAGAAPAIAKEPAAGVSGSLGSLHLALENGGAEATSVAGAPSPVPPLVAPEDPPAAELTKAQLSGFSLLSRYASEATLAEFRVLRSRLIRIKQLHENSGRRFRSLHVTSAIQGEGKTFVALNLGLMIAVSPHVRVLVVDVNVQRPSFQSRLRISQFPGLREGLLGAPWKGFVHKVPEMNLYVAPLGIAQNTPMEPVDGNLLQSWLSRVAEDFDWIILDGSALEESPEAEMISYVADSNLVAVDPRTSNFQLLDRNLSKIREASLAGVVLNRRPPAKRKRLAAEKSG